MTSVFAHNLVLSPSQIDALIQAAKHEERERIRGLVIAMRAENPVSGTVYRRDVLDAIGAEDGQ